MSISTSSKDLTEKMWKTVDFEANSSKMHIFLRIYNDIKTRGIINPKEVSPLNDQIDPFDEVNKF